MSLSDAPAYAEESDVRAAMQESTTAFGEEPLGTTNVETAIRSASRWFRRRAKVHFYDSAGTGLIDTSPATAEGIQLAVPSSPHAQQGQMFRHTDSVAGDVDYPVTHAGRYTRLKQQSGGAGLPYHYVESIDRLEARSFGGDTTDWVADAEFTEGRGEDYYLQVDGADAYGRSYLFVHAGSLGPHLNYDHAFVADVTYGLDWQDEPWADVRRGIGHLAAAELVVDDDVLTALPNEASLTGVDTEAQQHLDAAMDRYLGDYLGRRIA